MARKRFLIRQIKEWGEILVGFESRNRYEITDEAGTMLGYAAEEGGGIGRALGRQFLGSGRPGILHVLDPDGRETARAKKPFTWFFHRVDVEVEGKPLGSVRRRFSILNRKFTVETPTGEELFTIWSPMFRIWTFRILFRDQEVGVIRKQWGGALKEMFTDADVFGIEYDDLPELEAVRPLLLFATLLVDLCHFENNQGGSGLSLLDNS